MSIYEIGLLGDVTDADCDKLVATIARLISEFDLEVGREVIIRSGETFDRRNRRAATAVAYFGGTAQADQELARRALSASLPIIPTIPADGEFDALIPDFLRATNGLQRRPDDPDMLGLSVVLLECLGLLRQQRRVFVSYRRVESRNVAVQLHDLLSARGFDVFLDTHDIRPGEPFQDVLWHRLCDSDVMVMLARPRSSKRDSCTPSSVA
mgnify:FL=1